QACASYNYDGKFREKFGTQYKYKESTTCTVEEWWNPWWKIVWVDSHLIIGPVAHKLGTPPFIYQLGALGLPAFINDDSTVNADGTVSHSPGTNDAAMKNKGLSHVHLLRYPIGLR